MKTDLRCKHDASLLAEATRLHDAGIGRRAIGNMLGVPHAAVRRWIEKYRAGGMELLLKMGGKQARYDYGTKVAAAPLERNDAHVHKVAIAVFCDANRLIQLVRKRGYRIAIASGAVEDLMTK